MCGKLSTRALRPRLEARFLFLFIFVKLEHIMPRNKTRALALFSGGLDSTLAVKVLEAQGIDVLAIIFQSYFFGPKKAKENAKKNGIKIRIVNISPEHLKMVKNPKHGYGRAMNPCIDCHLLMIRKAAEIMRKEKFDFIATGEVLGQRPMSQNKQALEIIDKNSGAAGYLLRPLSAKLLPETEAEKSGLVNREKMLDFSGRSRKNQLALAKKYHLKYIPSSGGGCVLTEKEFSAKLKKLLEKARNPRPSDLALLKLGRHFWEGKAHIIIGRNEADNEAIEELAEKGDVLLELKDIPGPSALVRKSNKKVVEKAKELIKKYSKSKNYKTIEFKICEF